MVVQIDKTPVNSSIVVKAEVLRDTYALLRGFPFAVPSLRDLNLVLSALQNTNIKLIRDNPLSTLTHKVVFLAFTSVR